MSVSTYLEKDNSNYLGQPCELYMFSSASFASPYCYTSGDADVSYNSNTYTMLPISRSQPELSRETRAQQIVINVPRTEGLAQRWVNLIPPKPVGLTIYRFHITDTPTPFTTTFWQGIVRQVDFQGNTAQFTAQPIDFALSRVGLRHTFSSVCSNQLYDSGCRLDIDDFTRTTTVTAIDVNKVTITASGFATLPVAQGGGSAPRGYWTTGIIEVVSTGEMRQVIGDYSDTTKLDVLFPFENLVVGASIKVSAGCLHDFLTCKNKFANHVNYKGYPFMPSDNPFKVNIMRH